MSKTKRPVVGRVCAGLSAFGGPGCGCSPAAYLDRDSWPDLTGYDRVNWCKECWFELATRLGVDHDHVPPSPKRWHTPEDEWFNMIRGSRGLTPRQAEASARRRCSDSPN